MRRNKNIKNFFIFEHRGRSHRVDENELSDMFSDRISSIILEHGLEESLTCFAQAKVILLRELGAKIEKEKGAYND
jgi:hypothetical protein|tara:strand:+ start:572 stop:799 length:228 start_codon:yes stop_codon:yes gene_type:complete